MNNKVCNIVNNLLEANVPPEDAEVDRYLQQVKPKHQRLSKGFIRYMLSTPEGRKFLLHQRNEPDPPSEPHQIVREALDVPPDEPSDTRAELDRLLPTKTYTLKGSSLVHAPGYIAMAQNEWRASQLTRRAHMNFRSRKQKARALEMVKSWAGLPEEVYLAILNGQAEIETQGNDAVVTIRL